MNKRFLYKKHASHVFTAAFTLFLVFGTVIPEGIGASSTFSSWVTYWNGTAGEKDYQQIANRLAGLSCFAASFDKDNQLQVPDALLSYKEMAAGKSVYLTVVNDKVDADGQSKLKDTDLLKDVLVDKSKAKEHAREIISLAKKNGFSGVEIDYEGIWKKKDKELVSDYLRFLRLLGKEADKEHISVRVVLEPSTPFDEDFPGKMSYVVMLYNLYGSHSGPGPKADDAFIQKTVKRMKELPGTKEVAFSSGGCLWTDGKQGRFITEEKAVSLARQYKVEPKRDEDSQALTYSYTEDGHHMEVWYADAVTLSHWMNVAKELGIQHFSLWSLGGNESLKDIDI